MVAFLVLLLLCAEFSLRAYHQHTIRRALPTELRAETRALTWQDIKDKYRIVCFGDSITFGEDLSYEQAYPAVLEAELRERHPDLDVVVVNAGIRGQTSVQGLARLERDVLWYQPQVVLSAFGLNDGKLGYWPLDPIREREMLGAPGLRARALELLRRSHLYLTLRARTRRLLRREPVAGWLRGLGWRRQRPVSSSESAPLPRVSPLGFRAAQERLVDAVRRNGCVTPSEGDCSAVVVMTTTPVTEVFNAELGAERQREQWSLYDQYNGILRDVAAGHRVRFLDLQGVFDAQGRAQWSSLLAPDGVHLTEEGSRLVALSALQALEETGLPGYDAYLRR